MHCFYVYKSFVDINHFWDRKSLNNSILSNLCFIDDDLLIMNTCVYNILKLNQQNYKKLKLHVINMKYVTWLKMLKVKG